MAKRIVAWRPDTWRLHMFLPRSGRLHKGGDVHVRAQQHSGISRKFAGPPDRTLYRLFHDHSLMRTLRYEGDAKRSTPCSNLAFKQTATSRYSIVEQWRCRSGQLLDCLYKGFCDAALWMLRITDSMRVKQGLPPTRTPKQWMHWVTGILPARTVFCCAFLILTVCHETFC